MNEITPEQKAQLDNWVTQRDAILGEIAQNKTTNIILLEKNKNLTASNDDIEKRIQQSIGRLAELDNTEKLYMEVISAEIPKLISEKTALETSIPPLKKEIAELEQKKEEIKKDILFLSVTHDQIFSRTGALEQIVEHVTKVSSENITSFENALTDVTKKTKEILDLSDTNIKAHTEVLNEIPKLFVELQRKVLIK